MTTFTKVLTILFLFFNFAFPKAGTKLGSFPLYISLLLTIFAFLPLTFYKTIRNYKEREERFTLIFYGVFILLFSLSFLFVKDAFSISNFTVNYLPYFLALSGVFLIFTAKYFPLNLNVFKNIVLVSFFILTIYGFISKIFGEFNTIIPGITFNFSEGIKIHSVTDLIVLGKYNYNPTLNYIKLFSTYQNGNLFGVNYILISWFAFYFMRNNKNLLLKLLYYISILSYSIICLLTASGTVIIGMFLSLFLLYCLNLHDIYLSEDTKKIRKLILYIAAPVILILCFIIFINIVPFFKGLLSERLLNRNLLNNERIVFLSNYLNFLWTEKSWFKFLFGSFFQNPANTSGYEITLAHIFINSGILFTLFFIFYIITFIKKLKFSIYNIGIFSYLAASFIDGGFWLPPTPFSFFILLGFSIYMLKKNDESNIILKTY